MDRNGAPGVLEETTEDSMRDTLRWLDACQDLRHIKPILTPRFTPSCTNELMAFLGKLAAERDLPVQSHLSETARRWTGYASSTRIADSIGRPTRSTTFGMIAP